MELILGDGRREAEVAIQVNALSATVADLEDALAPFGRPPAGLFVGRRQLDREDRLSEAGLYRGAKVSFIAEGEGHLAPSVVFCVIGGLEAGRSSALTDGEYSIGRDASCAIVLPSQTVSPRHCTIMVRGGVARVVDNGSLAGTHVNRNSDRRSAGCHVDLKLRRGSRERSILHSILCPGRPSHHGRPEPLRQRVRRDPLQPAPSAGGTFGTARGDGSTRSGGGAETTVQRHRGRDLPPFSGWSWWS